ncbi:hypothetical protein HY772_07805 [Candidatus Woesearchaeota archaeon]|nr:hypothetical protein [Candidatus Woesearchaeota archaeon]
MEIVKSCRKIQCTRECRHGSNSRSHARPISRSNVYGFASWCSFASSVVCYECFKSHDAAAQEIHYKSFVFHFLAVVTVGGVFGGKIVMINVGINVGTGFAGPFLQKRQRGPTVHFLVFFMLN